MAITTVIPVWIEQVLNSYEQGEKCVDLIAKLSIEQSWALIQILFQIILSVMDFLGIRGDGWLVIQANWCNSY